MSAYMKAAVLHAAGDIRFETVPVPEIGRGEVLVRVKACGVCGSDPRRVMQTGTYRFPTIPGHEFAGLVAEIGEGVKCFKAGDRVAVVPIIPCGKCQYCGVGDFTVCDNYDFLGSRSDGAFAEYVKAPARNSILLPENVSFDAASMVDPACVALHGLRRAGGVEPGDRVAVLGAGPIGLFAVQWARAMGAGRVMVTDLLPQKLSVARELGADICINPRDEDVVARVREETQGRGADIVLETAGALATQQQCFLAARKQGKVILIGTSHSDVLLRDKTFDAIRRNELLVVGTINYFFGTLPHNEWETALEFMSAGRLQAETMITHRFKLEDAQVAFAMMFARSECFNKVLFIP